MQSLKTKFIPRAEFPPHNVPLGNFAAHHRRALADLRYLSGQLDFVLELRDSRAPLSSINPLIQQALPGVPKLTLYTKLDESTLKKSHLDLLHPNQDFRLISMDKQSTASQVLRELRRAARGQVPAPPLGFKVLVAGMPNAGKSTLINKFRTIAYGKKAKKVAFTGANPGITRAVSEQISICDEPKMFVLDTPGVLVPQLNDWEQMLKLCLIGAVPRQMVDPVVLADYLLFHINKFYPNGGRYPGELSNNIEEVLWNIAHTMRRKPQRDTWNPNHTADEWVGRFVRGGIGKIILDDMSIDNVQRVLAQQQQTQYDLSKLLPHGTSRIAKRKNRMI